MKTQESPNAISPELSSRLREALANVAKKVRDPDAAKKAARRMDQMREENRKLFGEQNVAVALIRETRERR